MITIRARPSADRAALLALDAELQEEHAPRPGPPPGPKVTEAYIAALETVLDDEERNGAQLVTETDARRLVGFLTCFVTKDGLEVDWAEVTIHNLVVTRRIPRCRRGAGRLVVAACRFAALRGIGRVIVPTPAAHPVVAGAYRTLGVQPVAITFELDATDGNPAL